MKQVQIATLRQIQEVTDEIGHQAPHRRDEVERRTRQIQTKLVQAMRELASLTDESKTFAKLRSGFMSQFLW